MCIKPIPFKGERQKFAIVAMLNGFIKRECKTIDSSKYIIYLKYTKGQRGKVYISPVKDIDQDKINDIIENSIISQIISKSTFSKIVLNYPKIKELMRAYD